MTAAAPILTIPTDGRTDCRADICRICSEFPTGAYIYGIQGVKDAYETGRGRIVMRAKAEIESGESHDKIVITEIPYGVNKAQLIEYVADLVKEAGDIDFG